MSHSMIMSLQIQGLRLGVDFGRTGISTDKNTERHTRSFSSCQCSPKSWQPLRPILKLRLRKFSFTNFKLRNTPCRRRCTCYINVTKPPHLRCIERTIRRRQNILLSDLNIAEENSTRCDVPSVNYECHSQDH